MTDTLERVKTYQQLIGGEFVDAADGKTADVVNPANDAVIGNVPASSLEDVNRAVDAAATAFETWKNTTPQDRSLLLLKLADILESRADEFGRLESANAGKPVGAAIDEMTTSVDLFRFFAGAARVMEGLAANEFLAGHTSIIRRDPIGVVASIAPWNYPLYMASWKLGPALATGNTVVLKPSARTPLSALLFAQILAEVFPPGVVNVLSGSGADIGDALVGHPTVRMVSITGDTVTGKRVAKIAADTVKRLHLELGGKAPVIIFDDADIELAAETLKFASYWNAGQDCTAATRVIAGPKVYDKFVSALSDQVKTIKWGDPAEGDDIEMGSLIAHAQADKVEGMVDRARAGAEVVVGGHRPDRAGSYYEPTIIAGPGPAFGDRPGRGVRAGRHRPAVQRRGAGRQVGERRPLRAGVLGLHERHRPRDAGGQGARVRARVDQRALHARVGDAARWREAVRLRQGRLQVRARGLHVHQARDDQHGDLNRVRTLRTAPPQRRSRSQFEYVDMGRPYRPKVALIECRDLRLAQALGERDDAGIDDTEREIGVASLQFAAAGKVLATRRFDAVDPSEQIIEEDEPGPR